MLHETVTHFITWVSLNPKLAGAVVFLIATAESIALLGTIVPGSVLMTAVGALIGMQILPMLPIFACAIVGAIFGDTISFMIGYYFRGRLHKIWPFYHFPKLLERGKTFFHEHGGKSIFLGRFVGPIRAITPLIAGTLHFKPWRFLIADIISAILWAPGFMIPGILVGALSTKIPARFEVYFILGLLGLMLLASIALWLIRHFYKSFLIKLNHALDTLWLYLRSKPSLKNLCVVLKYHDDHERGQLSRALALIILAGLLSVIALNVLHHTGLFQLNEPLNFFFQSIHHTPERNKTMVFFTILGEKTVLLPIALTLTAWLIFRKKTSTALHWLGLCLLTAASIELLKHGIASPRPPTSSATGYSFPSGHVTLSTALYGFLSYLVAKRYSHIKQALFYLPFLLLTFCIALSRLYLNAHWFTDVTGAFILGLLLMQIAIFSYRRISAPYIPLKDIVMIPLLTLLISAPVYCHKSYHTLLIAATPAVPISTQQNTHIIPMNTWWNNQPSENSAIPTTTYNHLGRPIQDLDIQWAGSIESIRTQLEKEGWSLMTRPQWKDLLTPKDLANKSNHLVVFKNLVNNQEPVLIMVKNFKDSDPIRLDLWATPSSVAQQNQKKALWVGTLRYKIPPKQWLSRLNNNKEKTMAMITQTFIDSLKGFEINIKNQIILIR